jgi:hypothetical protein
VTEVSGQEFADVDQFLGTRQGLHAVALLIENNAAPPDGKAHQDETGVACGREPASLRKHIKEVLIVWGNSPQSRSHTMGVWIADACTGHGR